MRDPRPEEITLQTPGLRLAARAWGPPDGRRVLGLHGWLDNAATWDAVAPRLSDLRLVSLDLPGHGRSAHRPAGASYHFVDMVPTIFAAADLLGWDRFDILGHSMGAAAATLAAGTFPDRIRSLALVDGLGPLTTAADRAPEQLARGIREHDALRHKTNRLFDHLDDISHTLARLYGLDPAHVRPLVERGAQPTEGGWRLTYDLALRAASLLRLTEPQLGAFFAAIRCPTLLIRPTDGWPHAPDVAARRQRWIEHLEVVSVEGTHHAHLSSPAQVASLVNAFFDAHPPSA